MSVKLDSFEALRKAASEVHSCKTEKQLEKLYEKKYASKKSAHVDKLILRMIFSQRMKEVSVDAHDSRSQEVTE